MKRTMIRGSIVLLFVFGTVTEARADGTVLLGMTSTSAPQPTIGFAFGLWRRPIGFEIEYAASPANGTKASASDGSISANLLVRTPYSVRGGRIYGVAGLGLYGASRGGGGTGEVQAFGAGVGVGYPLTRHATVRLEYRIFLGSAPDASHGWPRSIHASRVSAAISVPL